MINQKSVYFFELNFYTAILCFYVDTLQEIWLVLFVMPLNYCNKCFNEKKYQNELLYENNNIKLNVRNYLP